MGTLHNLCHFSGYQNNMSCQHLRAISLFSRRKEKLFGDHLGVPIKRSVHYEPHVNQHLDQKQSEFLKKFGVSSEDCRRHPAVFKIHPLTIEHHGLVLQEGGFKEITASVIINYYKIIKKKIHLLKIHDYIKPQTSVVNEFLRHLGNPPTEKLKLKSLRKDEHPFLDVYIEVVKIYLAWRLNSSLTEIERIMKTYPRIRHRSLKYLHWSLDILEHQLEFTKEKILRHGYLIHSYPYNTLDTIERVPELCGRDIKTVIHRHPKIIMTTTDTILAIVKHLKEYDIPDSAAQRCFDIFTLSSESIQQRLQQLRTVPELRPFVTSPRVLHVVHYQRKVNERLEQLQELQRQCASLHILTSNQRFFERFTREGMDRTRGTDLVRFLAQQLSSEEPTVRKYLARHPFWCSVSLLTVQATLDFLLERGFEKEDILRNIQLLLYPSDQVERTLAELRSSAALTAAKKLYRTTSTSEQKKSKVLTKSKQLALCAYFLEKDHHFTGNGIWNTQ